MKTREEIQKRIDFLLDFRTDYTEDHAPMTHMLVAEQIKELEWVLEE